jgi:hypothetical protein
MNVARHRHRRTDLPLLYTCVAQQKQRSLIATVQRILSLLRVRQAVAALTVGVPRKPVLPTSPSMTGGNRRIQVQSIAVFETNVAFVDHLHIGSAASKQKGTDNTNGDGDSRVRPFHDGGQTAGFSLSMQ